MLQRPSKITGIPEVLFSKTDTYIAATAIRTGHTHSYSNTPLHTPLVGSSQDSNLPPATPYPQADTSQIEGPNTLTTTSLCHIQNSLWHLLKGVHRPDG